ncbi:MAG: hypothetical protein NT023_10355 [Armatimonadetes bacterium]|nr:hypothetical protein [Armatimonadota bacterium]
MELREFEQEATEQDERGEEIEGEVQLHKERLALLETAASQLKAALQEVGSEESVEAIQSAEQAQVETERRMEELEREREEMLEENAEMQERVTQGLEKRQNAKETIDLLRDMDAQTEDNATNEVSQMKEALENDIRYLELVQEAIYSARKRLDAIEI